MRPVRGTPCLYLCLVFDVLESVERDFAVQNNGALTTVSGFGSLRSVGRGFGIFQNAVLRSIPSFIALRSIGNSDEVEPLFIPILISRNDMLSMCCGLFPFVQEELPDGYTLGGNGEVDIVGNAGGCVSSRAIRSTGACAGSHEASVSTMTADVAVGRSNGIYIPISLPADGTEAVFTIDVGAGATGWTAMELSDTDNFVSAVTNMGRDGESLTISYSMNTGTTSRRAVIRLRTTGPGTAITRMLSLGQRSTAASTITVTTRPSDLTSLTAEGGTIEATITIDGSATGWAATRRTEDVFITFGTGGETTASGVGNGLLMVTYAANATSEARTGMVTISTTGEGTPATQTLTFTQLGTSSSRTISVSTSASGVTIGPDDGATISISLPLEGASAALRIEVGGGATGWQAEEETDEHDFVSISPSSGSNGEVLTITYTANQSFNDRNAVLILRAVGWGSPASRTLSLTQANLTSIFGVSRGEGALVLYPNPVSGLLHIGGLQGHALVRVSTLGGRIVRRAPVSVSSSFVDVSDLRGGTYVVIIESHEATLSRRLVIIE